jgi:hypothetical protein
MCAIFILPGGRGMALNEQNVGTKKDTTVKTEFFKGGVKVEKVGNDSLVIHVKKHDIEKCCQNEFPFSRKKGKYNGHWAGIDFGWNGYVNPDFNMTFPQDQQYLNLRTSRSMMVNLNPFELNLNLVKNHFGLTSGLGFSLNNYYFSNSYMLIPDSLSLVAYKIVDEKGNAADMRVNKLYVGWLTVPVLFEYQTNPKIKANSFHVSLGVIGGIRLEAYQKMEFKNADNMTYYLQDQNGKTVGTLYIDNKCERKHSEFHLNPFKLDATMRVGWSFLNFWTTYSISPMFLNNQGPELYPWTVGITLLGW